MARARPAGWRRDASRSRAALLDAARRHFTERGYDRATVRGIAADADIDPTMVVRYFGGKDDLFAAAAAVDLPLPDLTRLPRHDLGRALASEFLRRWDGGLADDVLGMLLRSAATHPGAAARVREIFTSQVCMRIAAVAPDCAVQRAGLVASQLVGVAFCRYVLALPGIADVDAGTLAGRLAPAIQRYLTAPLP